MANFNSPIAGSLHYVVGSTRGDGGAAQYTTGYTVLTRVQAILAARRVPGPLGDAAPAYRRGGPLGSPATSIDPDALRIDGVHGPVTNGLLWVEIAHRARPTATLQAIQSGDAFAGDPGTLNVLDKIEESLLTGRLHRTAARAMLFLIESARDTSLTWARFMSSEDPWLSPDDFSGYALRSQLPFPSSPAGLVILPTASPALARATLMFSLTHCRSMAASMTAENIRGTMNLASLFPVAFAEAEGSSPRVTRTFAGLTESCHERIRARWPVTLSVPDPAVYSGSLERISTALAIRAASRLPEGMFEVGFAPFSGMTNGPLEWWRSGAAANTGTRDAARTGVSENPEGPDALRPEPQGTAEVAASAAKMIVGGAVTLGGLWVAGRALGVVQGVTTRTKRVEVAAAPKPATPAKKRR